MPASLTEKGIRVGARKEESKEESKVWSSEIEAGKRILSGILTVAPNSRSWLV
jgi:hypothetical protein